MQFLLFFLFRRQVLVFAAWEAGLRAKLDLDRSVHSSGDVFSSGAEQQ